MNGVGWEVPVPCHVTFPQGHWENATLYGPSYYVVVHGGIDALDMLVRTGGPVIEIHRWRFFNFPRETNSSGFLGEGTVKVLFVVTSG